VEFPLPDKLRRTRHRFIDVDGLKIFCREAGADTSPTLLLLHGFPTSSHMFRDLITALAERSGTSVTKQSGDMGDKLAP